jgi:CheY-like chemotaxis protein
LRLRFWGTRGSIATPGPNTAHFGGNTSCVEVTTIGGDRFIFDCGTGARPLGAHLMAEAAKPIRAAILFSHTHWDHIQGFPFFTPLFVPGNHFIVCGPQGCNRSLREVLAGQMEYTYFPVELGQLGATIVYQELVEGPQDLGGARVSAQFLNHPAITMGYRIEADGASLVYACDHEPYWEPLWRSGAEPGKLDSILHAGDRRHLEFIRNADVVIHDAQYTPDEYPAKKNWGHSTYSYVARVAAAAGVRRLFLTHHDPSHDDAFLLNIERSARAIAREMGSKVGISCAWEGCEESFGRAPDVAAARQEAQASKSGYAGPLTILVVDDDADLRLLARNVLTRGGHQVQEAAGGQEALETISRGKPDLVILDLNMPAPDGLEVLRILRSQKETESLPILVLTASSDEKSTQDSFELGATDYLNKPFTPPQLDARVRTCAVRSAEP